jgi:hypothetical protein
VIGGAAGRTGRKHMSTHQLKCVTTVCAIASSKVKQNFEVSFKPFYGIQQLHGVVAQDQAIPAICHHQLS